MASDGVEKIQKIFYCQGKIFYILYTIFKISNDKWQQYPRMVIKPPGSCFFDYLTEIIWGTGIIISVSR